MRTVAVALACLLAWIPASATATTTITPTSDSATTAPLADPTVPTPSPAPVLVVRSYETSVKRVLVGARFKLTLDIENATSRRAENVVVSLQSGTSAASAAEGATGSGGGLSVMGSGNAKFVGTIKGKEMESVTFDVMAGPGTAAGTYNVPVIIAFEYNGERQEITQTIGIVVERDATFSVVTAELPEESIVGETFDASFEIANTSGFALSAVTLSVEASGAAVVDGRIYLGAFDAAGSEAIDVQISPEKAGTLEVVLVVTYRDDFGQTKTFRSPYEVKVADKPKDTGDAVPDPTDDQSKSDQNPFVAFFMALLGLGA